MEYGVGPELPIYSGGLGILAGDHLKAASDLGIPLVGVGLFYHHGYFRQEINPDGWQIEKYPLVDPETGGLQTLVNAQNKPVSVAVDIEDRAVNIQAHLKQVGTVPLILLTTNVESNCPEDQMITAHLYGAAYKGDTQTRIRQEMVLGMGGKKMLDKLGFSVGVYHMNEGHSAFLTIARVEELVREGMHVEEALLRVRANQIFTNHTPVPAGNDIFEQGVLKQELKPVIFTLGQGFAALQEKANHIPDAPRGTWSQARFALSNSANTNAVSRLHAETMAKAWGQDKVDYVTNGVHHSWMDEDIKQMIDPDQKRFVKNHIDPDYLKERMTDIDLGQFRHLRGRKRLTLVNFAHEYSEKPYFDPEVLTVGFARRAATYKRLDLLSTDPDRLLKLITDPDYPVQIIMAAKAHPQDEDGKEVIQRMVRLGRDPKFKRNVLFIPDYDSRIAKTLVTGSDVWMNVPMKPQEASATSGMKSGINGGRQWSVDDGWMNEVPDRYYFKIEDDLNPGVVATRMYDMLGNIIAPQFYSSKGQSDGWLRQTLASMEYIISHFSAQRMVQGYNTRFYQPLMR
ncbi:alpha-glucan family phosphorylase [Candidatus Daviesbacteria bacterium]|nr:alpha-glucan family phosphorylase [Candidatus Daviesbacteria bacterium]